MSAFAGTIVRSLRYLESLEIRPRYLIYLLVPVMQVRSYLLPTFITVSGLSVRLDDLLVVLLCFSLLLESALVNERDSESNSLKWPIILYFSSLFLSQLKALYLLDFSQNLWSMKLLIKQIEAFLVYIFCLKFIRTRDQILVVLRLLILGGILQFTVSVLASLFPSVSGFLHTHIGNYAGIHSGSGVFSGLAADKNQLGLYFASIFPICLVFVLMNLKRFSRFLSSKTLLLVWWIGILLTLSRSSIFASIAGLIYFCVLIRYRISSIIFVSVPLLLTAILIISVVANENFTRTAKDLHAAAYYAFNRTLVRGHSSSSAVQRVKQFEIAYLVWLRNPILGLGNDGYRFSYLLYPDIVDSSDFRGFYRSAVRGFYTGGITSDNQYTAQLVNHGIIGLFALLFLIATLVWLGWKTYSEADSLLIRSFGAIFSIIFAQFALLFFGRTWLIYLGNSVPMLFWLLAGLTTVSYRLRATSQDLDSKESWVNSGMGNNFS